MSPSTPSGSVVALLSSVFSVAGFSTLLLVVAGCSDESRHSLAAATSQSPEERVRATVELAGKAIAADGYAGGPGGRLLRLVLPSGGRPAAAIPADVATTDASVGVDWRDYGDGDRVLSIHGDSPTEGRVDWILMRLVPRARFKSRVYTSFAERIDDVVLAAAVDETDSAPGSQGRAMIKVLRSGGPGIPRKYQAYVCYGGVIIEVDPWRKLREDEEAGLVTFLHEMAGALVAHYDSVFAPIIAEMDQ